MAGPPPSQRQVIIAGLRPRPPSWRRTLKWSLFSLIVLFNLGVAAAVAGWFHFASGLPELPSIEGYRPPIVTELVSSDGQISAEFFSARRKVVPYNPPASCQLADATGVISRQRGAARAGLVVHLPGRR